MSVTARVAMGYGALAVCAIGMALTLWLPDREPPVSDSEDAGLDLGTLLGGDDSDGFARATEVRAFRFPDDHGPHPEFRSEWWYFTGNLESEGGRQFGYQWTLFRFALSPESNTRRSSWATRHAYMGHFTVTDVAAGRFHADERLARGALGLAGARAEPFRAWIEDWEVSRDGPAQAWRLRAASQDVAIDLQLVPGKPVVMQGDRGLSQKGVDPGNASYYYSIPRLQTEGEVRLNGESFTVHGSSWLDREWSTSALEPGQAGWDWFGLQLSDGTELMFYQLRREDGGSDSHSAGSFVDAHGEVLRLGRDDVKIVVPTYWDSPHGGRYPARWRITVEPIGLELDLMPKVSNQELDLSVRYWEGAVEIAGSRTGAPVTGHGYVELTGY